ncbi:DUF1707 domain-containing protein [Hoyosella rhizosphaerae]|uniref:DUF1707 domain-containing protein n=1 Tax=Hoyosella rhizosphaerae TaxID=1755582 RepID=A0A916U242_9ACTN|nr:DUF1707 domain-containing protein [Hoyosella rhizosphaerae]MBN4927118.1 DUF1707 domain-containing protein [Hoyosella rhizosphaerae]GGC53860.1 hypothetical protein GCM10011410_02780 [Hoyosella rhizosphaerae]
MDITPSPRASTADREHVLALLGKHMNDGRIDIAEYDERTAHVYAAQAVDEVNRVLADLPPLDAHQHQPKITPPPRRRTTPLWLRAELQTWISVGAFCIALWLAISLASGGLTYPWPVWVIGPWGAVLAVRMLTGFESRCSKSRHWEHAHKIAADHRARVSNRHH